MKPIELCVLAALAASIPSVPAATWTTTNLADGQSADSVSAIGTTVSVTDPAASAAVSATTGEGLFRANLDGSSAGYGALSLGVPSDGAAPALQAGANVSFAGRATPRDGWDYSWLDLGSSGNVAVSSGSLRVRDVSLPASASTIVKTGAGDLAVGSLSAAATGVEVVGGTLSLGRSAPADVSAPAADPIVWLAADRLRDEDLVVDDGTTYLARWHDARGDEAPESVDGFTAYPIHGARPLDAMNKTFLASRDGGAYPTVVADGLDGKPVIDFGPPWFTKDGTDWATSGSACMALENSSNGSITIADIAREGFIVVAQNSQYDVPVVWSHGPQFFHSGYGSVAGGTQGGGPILALQYAGPRNVFGLWSIDAAPVSPVDASSFSTAAFKNGSYHLVSFKTTSTGGRGAATLIASDRYNQNGVGGVRVAEILYYCRELTDAERAQTQAYLMHKWGLGTHPAAADIDLDSATVASGATLEYAGSGTMSAASAAVRGAVAAKSGTLSLASDDIAADAVLHLDASARDTLDTFDDGGTTFVRSWRDVRGNGFVAYSVTNTAETAANDEASYARNVAPYVLVTALPTLHDAAVGSKTMPCVDLGDMYKGTAVTDGSAATMLFNRTISFAEGYIVFFDNNTTSSGQRMTIWGLFNGGSGNYNMNLLRGATTQFYGTSSTLRSGNHVELVRLDGAAGSVSGTNPSRGAFHQYTLGLDAANSNIRSFGRDTDNRFGGLKVCEAIAFSERLDEARRLRLEQYLMDKWFGAEHPDAASIVQETTEGLSVASGASFAFDGDMAFASGAALSFDLGEAGVPGTASVSGKVSFAGPATISVTSARPRLPDGDYVLLSAGSMAEPADFASWTVSTSSLRDAHVEFRDGALVLRVRAGATVVFFR